MSVRARAVSQDPPSQALIDEASWKTSNDSRFASVLEPPL